MVTVVVRGGGAAPAVVVEHGLRRDVVDTRSFMLLLFQ